MTTETDQIIEAMARALYTENPLEDGGEQIDGLQVTPAGAYSFDAAQEAAPGYTELFRRDARAVLATLTGCLERMDAWQMPEPFRSIASSAAVRMRQRAGDLVDPPHVIEGWSRPTANTQLAEQIARLPLFDIPCAAIPSRASARETSGEGGT